MTQIVNKTGVVVDSFAGMRPLTLSHYSGGGALQLSFDDDLKVVSAHFSTLKLIVVPFENFADGRGFSTAAQLRLLGYRGHLRASGHILVDQFRAAQKCGFDDLEIGEERAIRNPMSQWLAVADHTIYQLWFWT